MSRRSALHVAAALLFAAGWLGAVPQLAVAQPTLSHVTPHAVAPGRTIEIRLHGTKLDGALRVWTSFAAQVEVVAADSKKGDSNSATCKISIGLATPVGIGGIAVATSDGVSEVVYLMIDDLPSVADSGNNDAAGEPQQISLPVAVDGQSDGTLADYFRFSARAGERISCEIVA